MSLKNHVRGLHAAVVAVMMVASMIMMPVAGAQAPTLYPGNSKKSSAVMTLQSRLEMKAENIDGFFGKDTLGKVIDLQAKKGLRPDGIVGAQTWGYVNNPSKKVTTKSFGGTGERRIVVDKRHNIVFLVEADGSVHKWFWMIDGPATPVGKHQMTTYTRHATSSADSTIKMNYMSRFAPGIGFHSIPRKGSWTGEPLHAEGKLGYGTDLVSNGCVRLKDSQARYMYEWSRSGMSVNVVERL